MGEVTFSSKLNTITDSILKARRLNSIQVDNISDTETFRQQLHAQSDEAAEICGACSETIKELVDPLLSSTGPLPDECAAPLMELCRSLLDQTDVAELDLSLTFVLSARLFEDALLKKNDNDIIAAAFVRINVCYANVVRANRVRCGKDLTVHFLEEGIKASEVLLSYLDKEKFAKIDNDRTKYEILTMSYFYVAIYDTDYVTDEINRLRLDTLIASCARMEDPFFRENAPAYNFHYGLVRSLEHMGQLTENGNNWGYHEEDHHVIASHAERLYTLWNEDKVTNEQILPKVHLELILNRNRHFDGSLSTEQYRGKLLAIYRRYANNLYDHYSLFANLFIPVEYLATFPAEYDEELFDDDSIDTIGRMYSQILAYILRSSNDGAHYFLLEYLTSFLERFIEIPGGVSFLEMSLQCLSALHLPTYVHTVLTARISVFLLDRLIERTPEALIGIMGCETEDDVRNNRDAMLARISAGALSHDIGKLTVMDTVFVTWRDLYDIEKELLSHHPEAGERMLNARSSTRHLSAYARYCAARFDDEETASVLASHPDSMLIRIVSVANALDGSDIDTVIAGTGSLFDPAVTALLRDTKITDSLRVIIPEQRDHILDEAFLLLKSGIFHFKYALRPVSPDLSKRGSERKADTDVRLIRNALNAVMGMSEAILNEKDQMLISDYAMTIISQAQEISRSADNLAGGSMTGEHSSIINRIPRRRQWDDFTTKNARILIADHRRANLASFMALLKRADIIPDTTDSAQHLMEMICDIKYDLIMLDDSLPFAECEDLLRKVRSFTESKNTDTPLIVMTCDTDVIYRASLLTAGFSDCLTKPFGGIELEKILLRHIKPDKISFSAKKVRRRG